MPLTRTKSSNRVRAVIASLWGCCYTTTFVEAGCSTVHLSTMFHNDDFSSSFPCNYASSTRSFQAASTHPGPMLLNYSRTLLLSSIGRWLLTVYWLISWLEQNLQHYYCIRYLKTFSDTIWVKGVLERSRTKHPTPFPGFFFAHSFLY